MEEPRDKRRHEPRAKRSADGGPVNRSYGKTMKEKLAERRRTKIHVARRASRKAK